MAAAEAGQPRRFSMVANTGEPMSIWGFDGPVVVDLASVDTSGLPVPALYDHCAYGTDYIVGLVETAASDGAQLTAAGRFTPTDSPDDYANKVLAKSDAGYSWQVSVGGDPKQVDKIPAGQSAQVNGRTYAGPVSIARGLVLREISFVVLGADRRTSAVVSSSKGSKMSFEEFAQSKGFSADKLDETQMANLKQWHASEYPEGDVNADATPPEEPAADQNADPSADPPSPEDKAPTNAGAQPVKVKAKSADHSEAAALRAEKARIASIEAKAAEYKNPSAKIGGETVNICAHAIAEGWAPEKAELEMLRASRIHAPKQAPAVHVKDAVNKQSLQAAMILRAGGSLTHKAYKTMGAQALLAKTAPWLLRDINDADRDRYMNAGHRYANMSMLELCRESLRLDGKEAPADRDDMIRAAFSGGGNLSNVFTTNVNAVLLATYDEFGADTTAGWVSEMDVNDFKTQERPRVNVGDGLKKLPRGGEAEHTSYTDSVESYKIARYARQFEIDEQDVIDDNFGVFQDVPRQMGRAAARLRPDLVYGAVILANPTLTATGLSLFSDSNATDNNLSGALGHANLSVALATQRIVRENGVNLNLESTHLIVPPRLEDTALEITESSGILYGADDETVRGDMNVLTRRGLQVVAEPRLENGVTDPASETAQSGSASVWYLVCANAHTIEVGYLKGTGRAPRVRPTVLDKGRWGMNWDVSMDIGVKALDWKGMFKSS